MIRTFLAATMGAVLISSCATTGGDDLSDGGGSSKASACLLTKDLAAYDALSKSIPSKASAGRIDAIIAKADALEALADKASDTSNYAAPNQMLSCRFIEVQARVTLAEIAFLPDAEDGLVSGAQTAIDTASGLCPIETTAGRRECALLTEYYGPTLFARSAVKQLDALTTIPAEDAVNWQSAETTTASLTEDVQTNWAGSLAAAKASMESDMAGAETATPYNMLRREYEELSCIAQRATTELSKAALKPQNMTEDGQLRDYDLRGQVLRASLVTELKLASTDEDTACYGQYEDAACRRKLGQSVLAAFCADKLMAQPE